MTLGGCADYHHPVVSDFELHRCTAEHSQFIQTFKPLATVWDLAVQTVRLAAIQFHYARGGVYEMDGQTKCHRNG